MRIAIVPQGIISVGSKSPVHIKSIFIDPYPPIKDINPPMSYWFNELYNNPELSISIDGIASNRSFKSVIEDPNRLIDIISDANGIMIQLEKKNCKANNIKSISIEFKSPAIMGTRNTDNDISQAKLILKNYGYELTDKQYRNIAISLDILDKNGLLVYDNKNILNVYTQRLIATLPQKLDYHIYDPENLHYLISNNYISIDENGNISPESRRLLALTIFYQDAVNNTDHEYYQYQLDLGPYGRHGFDKRDLQKYYEKNISYIKPIDNSSDNKDTIIQGSRYVLMLGWQGKDFLKQPCISTIGQKRYYKAIDTFFYKPLILAAQGETALWWQKHSTEIASPDMCHIRLMQLLGLPPNTPNDLYVEFWVKESDLYRPSMDSSLGQNSTAATLDTLYFRAYKQYYISAFDHRKGLFDKRPFTGLGYTYDWNPGNDNHIGLNEYYLKAGSQAIIRAAYKTSDYILLLQNGR